MAQPMPISTDPVIADLQAKYAALVASAANIQVPAVVIPPTPSFLQTFDSKLAADIRKVLTDAEGTVTHVHGAAKTLQADIRADWKMDLLLAGMVFTAVVVILMLFQVL